QMLPAYAIYIPFCHQHQPHYGTHPDNEGDFFYYFAYGSNLLKERLLMANPSARFHCRGRLKGYSLKFGSSQGIPNKTWHGGSATIREAPGDEVWGVVWKMSTSDLQSLDRQQGVVINGVYSPLLANVETENGELPCRTYQMNNCADKCPSPQYKYVIVLGAKQNGLPEYYIKRLEAVEVNDNKEPTILEDIPIGVC
uniref:Gamma-glutamylcyclotransferase n=1 Tax=Erpetoichthys calabaricus TaxID=27687 RepID=A0A8C4STD6_ERPCA